MNYYYFNTKYCIVRISRKIQGRDPAHNALFVLWIFNAGLRMTITERDKRIISHVVGSSSWKMKVIRLKISIIKIYNKSRMISRLQAHVIVSNFYFYLTISIICPSNHFAYLIVPSWIDQGQNETFLICMFFLSCVVKMNGSK